MHSAAPFTLPTTQDQSETTCLLLEAGASRASDFKLPTMASFFKEEDLEEREQLRRFLEHLFPRLETSQYNLEDEGNGDAWALGFRGADGPRLQPVGSLLRGWRCERRLVTHYRTE